MKSGNKSVADLSSPDFDYNSIQPFKRADFENKYTFFGAHEEGPIINLELNDIQINKKEKKLFQVQPKSSKNQDKKPSTNEHRRSNNFFGREKKNDGMITLHNPMGTKKFHDLRMYLKVPKKK